MTGPRRVLLYGGLVLLVVVFLLIVLTRDGDDPEPGLTVQWGGGEGQPPCSYSPADGTVVARVVVRGDVVQPRTVTVTVTAYADENTSRPVGSGSRDLQVAGTVDESLRVDVPVSRAPHRGEDGGTACTFSVKG